MSKLTLKEVYSKHRTILQVIKEYEQNKTMPTYSELLKESKLPESSFYRSLTILEKGGFIKNRNRNGQSYYILDKWGDLLLGLEKSNDFWSSLVILELVYITDGPKVILDG